MKILYVQSGPGIGGAKLSLLGILSCAPVGQLSQAALTPPLDARYHDAMSRLVEKIHYLELPTWNAYRRKGWLEKIKAPFSHARRLLSMMPAGLKLMKIIKREHIDLVHTNNAMCPVGALAARMCGVPHVWHIREPIGKRAEYPLILGDRLAACVFQALSSAVVCNSEYTAGFFRHNSIPARVVRNGLDVLSFQIADAQKRGMRLRERLIPTANTLVVGMVGNLSTAWKRHVLFLACAAILRQRDLNCRFVIFGGSTDLEFTAYTRSLKAVVTELGLASTVILEAFSDDIPAIMHSLDLLVHPAATEGSGRAVMEAMAAGKAVVAVNAGGVRELIEDGITGFLVQPEDAHALANRAGFLLKDAAARRSMGSRAREYAQQNFSVEAMMRTLEEIYSRLVPNQRTASVKRAEIA